MRDYIYVTLSTFGEFSQEPLDRLRTSGVPFGVNPTGQRITPTELRAVGSNATVLIAGVEEYDASMLNSLTSLRCISRCGAGIDSIDLAAARARGVAVLNTPDVPTDAVAELAVTMMLVLLRRIPHQSEIVRGRRWSRVEAHLLAGRTVGLVGLGRIGRRVVELLTPFRCRVIAVDPSADAGWAKAHSVEVGSLEQVLPVADVLTLHASSSPTAPLHLGERQIRAMKRGAILINVARGAMVDDGAVANALQEGRLGGAGFDVFPREPYTGPLCDAENVVLTPHSATLTVQTRVAMELECVDKALRFLSGRLHAGERIV